MATLKLPKSLTLTTKNPILDPMFKRIQLFIDAVISIIILDGRRIAELYVPTGAPLNVEHGLKRPCNGYFILKRSANAVIWDDESTNTMKDTFLIINSSANVIIDIWVF